MSKNGQKTQKNTLRGSEPHFFLIFLTFPIKPPKIDPGKSGLYAEPQHLDLDRRNLGFTRAISDPKKGLFENGFLDVLKVSKKNDLSSSLTGIWKRCLLFRQKCPALQRNPILPGFLKRTC